MVAHALREEEGHDREEEERKEPSSDRDVQSKDQGWPFRMGHDALPQGQ